MNQRDRMPAVLAAEAFDESFGKNCGPTGVEQMAARDSQLGADVIDLLAPGIGADGAAEFSEGVGLDNDLVLDGLVGVGGMIQIHRMLGRDDPVHRRDAAVGGADGETPGARRAGEEGTATAGQSFGKFIRIGHYFWAEFLPGF